ncbi:MAG: hypothetical protein WCQ99_06905 [Pseudomonadota bacterium]
MASKHDQCEVCLVRECNPELCRVKYKSPDTAGRKASSAESSLSSVSRTAAIGAGVGALATGVGIAVMPLVGLTAALGIALTIKVCGRGGLIGAGVNMALKAAKKTKAGTQPQAAGERKKRRSTIF